MSGDWFWCGRTAVQSIMSGTGISAILRSADMRVAGVFVKKGHMPLPGFAGHTYPVSRGELDCCMEALADSPNDRNANNRHTARCNVGVTAA